MKIQIIALCAGLLTLTGLPLRGASSLQLDLVGVSGNTVEIAVQYFGPSIAGLQWTLAFPAGASGTTVIGSTAHAASKTLSCAATAATQICMLWGDLNADIFRSGQMAVYDIIVPGPGTYKFSIEDVLGALADAGAVAITGNTLSVKVKK